MRTFPFLCGLALVLGAQDAEVESLVRRLDDDAVDARAEALNALVRLGKKAVPALEKARRGASPELRERIAEILRKIEERERLAVLIKPAARITLQARSRPLREVLEAVGKQAGTPIDLESVPEDENVTVALSKIPFWEALEAVCRANGNVVLDVQGDLVGVAREKYVGLPRHQRDSFAVSLQGIEMTSGGSLDGQERYEEFRARVRVCWEKGVRPWRVTARLAELSDDRGESLILEDDEDRLVSAAQITGDLLCEELEVSASRVPPPEAATLGRLKIEIDCEFALRYSGVTFAGPEGKVGTVARCPELAATLVKWSRNEKGATASLQIRPQQGESDPLNPEEFVVKDKNGKEYAAVVQSAGGGDDEGYLYQFSFPVPAEVEVKELSVRVPVEIHKERLDLDLKGLPLK